MSFAIWCHALGCNTRFNNLPYIAQSPLNGKKKEFKTEKDIYNEIKLIVKQPSTNKYGLGQTLYYNLPFFCNYNFLVKSWHIDMINDYYLVKEFNVPIGSNLDSLNAWKTDCFILIKNELTKVENYQRKQQNG